MKEFKLSDNSLKRDITYKEYLKGEIFHIKDVKEFIKRLKEDFDNPSGEVHCSVANIHRIIDKLAGDLK